MRDVRLLVDSFTFKQELEICLNVNALNTINTGAKSSASLNLKQRMMGEESGPRDRWSHHYILSELGVFSFPELTSPESIASYCSLFTFYIYLNSATRSSSNFIFVINGIQWWYIIVNLILSFEKLQNLTILNKLEKFTLFNIFVKAGTTCVPGRKSTSDVRFTETCPDTLYASTSWILKMVVESSYW